MELFDFCGQLLARFEIRGAVGRNGGVGGIVDVVCPFLVVVTDGKGAESAEVDVMALCHVGLNGCKELINNDGAIVRVDPCAGMDCFDDFGFSH